MSKYPCCMLALYWRFSEKGCNFKIGSLKVTWSQVCYWSFMEQAPNKRVLFQFGVSVFAHCLGVCGRISVVICIGVRLKMDMLPLSVFLLVIIFI